MMSGGLAAMFLGIVLWVGFFTLLAWAIYTIVTNFGVWKGGRRNEDPHEPGAGERARADSAEELLRERFARGEIDAEEYERSLAVLKGDRAKTSVTE